MINIVLGAGEAFNAPVAFFYITFAIIFERHN